MDEKTINIIKNNKMIKRFLREESYHYRELYRDNNYIKTIEQKVKEKYKLNSEEPLEKIKNTIDLINTFISVIE